MSAKALLITDVQIARLRETGSRNPQNAEVAAQLERLLKKREELIPGMLAERAALAFAC